MQYNRRVGAGCTVLDPPYALEDRLALKDHTELLKPVEYWAPASTTRSLNAPNNSLLVLPCLMKPDLVPPVMFGRSEHHGTSQPVWGLGWRRERRRSIEKRL